MTAYKGGIIATRTPRQVQCATSTRKSAREREKNVLLIFHYLRMHGACVVRCVVLYIYISIYIRRCRRQESNADGSMQFVSRALKTRLEEGKNNFQIDF
jgi:hypothetical protein